MKANLSRIISSAVMLAVTACLLFGVNKTGNALLATLAASVSVQEETTSEEPVTEESTTEISYEDTFNVVYPSETVLTTENPIITFSGTANADYSLTIGGNAVEIAEDGSFAYDVTLSTGENAITVTNGVKTAEYKITYELKIIASVSPSKNLRVEGGTSLELSASALKGSTVYAVINGTTVSLSDAGNDGQYADYYGIYTVPSASSQDVSLGKIAFYGEYNGMSYSVKGGSITVNAYSIQDIIIEKGQGTVVAPEISGDDVVNVLSPYDDHGKGTASMLIVNADYAETVSGSTADDKSDPRCTPELKGTVDYIKSAVSYEGTDYYITMSGVKVKQEHVTAFTGYIMPTNTISTYKSYTSDGYTNVILTMNWKVPFSSEMKEQSYYTGYSGRTFNVSSFTATYIDFNFKYTNAAEGTFDFSNSSVVRSAEWVNIGTDGTATLRVYFRNSGAFYGYRAYYSNDNRLCLQFNEKPSTSSAVVVLDPGHGGSDCGAIAVNGTYEASINLRISAMVKQNLENAGIKVIILRTDDSTISLDDRRAAARKAGGDIYVAIHCNSSTSSSLSGTEVYYYRAMSKALASDIHSCLATTWRGIYSDNPSMSGNVVASDGGVRYYPFRVTRIEECPAVLVECGYLSNPTECEKLCNSYVQQRLAGAISDGIINYFGSL